jgi:antitoxin component YwqK of YwqJK toxin-antitoxin module
MKIQTLSLLILTSLLICRCGSGTPSVETTTKCYYLDSTSIDASDSSYYYGHFKYIEDYSAYSKYSVDYSSYFNFTTPIKIVEIYYDTALLKIAEKITFTKKDQSQLYQRFDKKGNLIAEKLIKNGSLNTMKIWHENHNLKWISRYNDNKQGIGDTSFFENQTIKDIDYFVKGRVFKHISYYRNGKIREELYHSALNNFVFEIHYDSLNLEPTMYYIQDSTWEDKDNPGTMISSLRRYAVDSVRLTKAK